MTAGASSRLRRPMHACERGRCLAFATLISRHTAIHLLSITRVVHNMRMPRALTTSAVGPIGCIVFALQSPAAAQLMIDQDYALAIEAQVAGDYAAMMSLLAKSAEAGHVQAQELLGVSLLLGDTLYGGAVQRDPCRARFWLRRASARGSTLGTTLNET